jgi:hypothetical protein
MNKIFTVVLICICAVSWFIGLIAHMIIFDGCKEVILFEPSFGSLQCVK